MKGGLANAVGDIMGIGSDITNYIHFKCPPNDQVQIQMLPCGDSLPK